MSIWRSSSPRTSQRRVATLFGSTASGMRLRVALPDECSGHEGRGPAIRQAREAGLEQARLKRLAWHREHRQSQPSQEPDDVG